MAKFLDTAGLTYLWGKIKTALSGKVDKVSGKGLSTYDSREEQTDRNRNRCEQICASELYGENKRTVQSDRGCSRTRIWYDTSY